MGDPRRERHDEPRRRAAYLIASLAITFLAMRGFLHWRPDTDVDIGPYNVHHLFTGVLILALCGIPLVIGAGRRASALLIGGFGAGLSLALDEWVYLIVTDGSNASYLLPISLVPGAVLVAAACGYAAVLGRQGGPRGIVDDRD